MNLCEMDLPEACVNACNGRGRCIGGWCHCKAGFYGADCSLSLGPDGKPQLLGEMDALRNPQGPRVYIYELPPEMNVKRNMYRLDRPALFFTLWERFLTSGHRTPDPEEADYFFIPVSPRLIRREGFLMVLRYVQKIWPYWNMYHGHRHIITAEGDLGACDFVYPEPRLMTANVTFLTYFGLHDYHKGWDMISREHKNCAVRKKDIVVPHMALSAQDIALMATPHNPINAPRALERTTTLFFAGGLCGWKRKERPPDCPTRHGGIYSGNVRQEVYLHHHTRPNFKIVPSTSNMIEDYLSSKFCLAPQGGGFGKRGVAAVFMGCVPVLATDHMYEFFEPEIPWTRFGIRISQSEIPNLHKILETVSPETYHGLVKNLTCAAQHLHYSASVGGIMGETGEFDAFNTIIQILRMRLKYPDMEPEDYYHHDAQFRDFVDCVPKKRDRPLPTLCTANVLLKPPKVTPTPLCPKSPLSLRRRIGPVGGALCLNMTSPAECSRVIGDL